MKATGSQRLMEFHQPFLTDVSHRFPRADILLGKPFPIAAAARFYDGGKSGRSGAKVHWLVDSADRLRQYAEFAAQTDRRMSIALEIDVGFHRGGFATPQEAALALTAIKADPRLTFAGFMGYDVHISIFAQTLGPMEASRDRTRAAYEGFLSAARSVDPAFADPAKLILNTGGSTTYPLYRAGRAVTPCNDLALGSGLLKPTFCDRTLPNHVPAVFIATPVLKVLDGVRVPGLETDPRGGANDALERTKTVFLYGGKWMADAVWPTPLSPHPVYGRSSNQDMFTAPSNVAIAVDDLAFFRPTQTEGVLLQFGEIAVFSDGRIVDSWQLLNQV
jgi:D-serine deaminase-like pyridoxal phosphate-dependent protein